MSKTKYNIYENQVVDYCVQKNITPRLGTIADITKECFKNSPIKQRTCDENGDWSEKDITGDVAVRFESDKLTLARIIDKIECRAQEIDNAKYEENKKQLQKDSVPDLIKLTINLHRLNIVDGRSYLRFTGFLMQTVYRLFHELDNDDKTCIFMNGVGRDGKSSTCQAILKVFSKYGRVHRSKGVKVFEEKHELKLQAAHLSFIDEANPCGVCRELLFNAVNGGDVEIEPKNQNKITIKSNTNYMFASNTSISLYSRRISVIKFGDVLTTYMTPQELESIIQNIVESLPDWKYYDPLYQVIANSNVTEFNPLGFDAIITFLAKKFPDKTRPNVLPKDEIFSETQVLDSKNNGGKHFITPERKEAIHNAFLKLVDKGFLEEHKYDSCTSKYYKISFVKYQDLREWFDKINTSREENKKISLPELQALLAPYFGPDPNRFITPQLPAQLNLFDWGKVGVTESKGQNGTQNNETSTTTLSDSSSDKTPPEIKKDMDVLHQTEMTATKVLSIDIETYSDKNLGESGVYVYSESKDFEILLLGYSFDKEPVKVIDIARGEQVPEEFLKALTDDSIIKSAFNANFERVCLSNWLLKHHPKYFKGYTTEDGSAVNFLDPTSWHCSSVASSYSGLPRSLKDVGKALNLQNQKLDEGGDLIRYFSCQCKPTKKNEGRTRNLPEHAPEKWERFKEYNKRDVEVEMAIMEAISEHPVPAHIWAEYRQDQIINDRGMLVDENLVKKCITLANESIDGALTELKELTHLENPNSLPQFKYWLRTKGVITKNLDANTVTELLTTAKNPEAIRALKLKSVLSKSSIAKYSAAQLCMSQDGRVRGGFMFYNTISGRWTGARLQPQNMPKPHPNADVKRERDLVLNMDYDAIKSLDHTVPEMLSGLARTIIIPKEGFKLIVADYNAIEARVLAFMAGEQWVIDAFKRGDDIYCTVASQMFGVPVEENGKNAELRTKGKISVLALGYGGACGALKNMGALEMGIKEEELEDLVESWREANPMITKYWYRCGHAAVSAIENKSWAQVGDLTFRYAGDTLFITLPSGRDLAYKDAYVQTNDRGFKEVVYTSPTKNNEVTISGPKFVENIIQGISRDLLANALINLAKYNPVGHVHDEVICEVPMDTDVKTICDIMCKTPAWAEGLPLKAKGYECQYYQKQ